MKTRQFVGGVGGASRRFVRGWLASAALWIGLVAQGAESPSGVRHFPGEGRQFAVLDLVPKETPAAIRERLEKSAAVATINVRWTDDNRAFLEGWRGDRWLAAGAKLEARPVLWPMAPGVVALMVESQVDGCDGSSIQGGKWRLPVGLLKRSEPGVISEIPSSPASVRP